MPKHFRRVAQSIMKGNRVVQVAAASAVGALVGAVNALLNER